MECPEHDTKLHLMVRFVLWNPENVEYLFIVITASERELNWKWT